MRTIINLNYRKKIAGGQKVNFSCSLQIKLNINVCICRRFIREKLLKEKKIKKINKK